MGGDAQVEFEALARAIARVGEDYRAETDPDATVEEAIAHTRAEVDHDDLVVLTSPAYGEPLMSHDLAAAYRQVLDAPEEVLTPAMTSHAEGVLDGPYDDDRGDDDPEGDPAEVEVIDQLAGRSAVVFDAPDEAHLARVEAAREAAERGDFAEARRLIGIDDADLSRQLQAQRDPLEVVEVAESCNAALACAAATAAAAEAAARARAVGDEDAVAGHVAGDVANGDTAVDEDGGLVR